MLSLRALIAYVLVINLCALLLHFDYVLTCLGVACVMVFVVIVAGWYVKKPLPKYVAVILILLFLFIATLAWFAFARELRGGGEH